jgi:hypothetical protein
MKERMQDFSHGMTFVVSSRAINQWPGCHNMRRLNRVGDTGPGR